MAFVPVTPTRVRGRPAPPPPPTPLSTFRQGGRTTSAPALISTFPCLILALIVRAVRPACNASGPVQLAPFWFFFDRHLITNNILARVSVGACFGFGVDGGAMRALAPSAPRGGLVVARRPRPPPLSPPPPPLTGLARHTRTKGFASTTPHLCSHARLLRLVAPRDPVGARIRCPLPRCASVLPPRRAARF